jgi:hypothetical protein
VLPADPWRVVSDSKAASDDSKAKVAHSERHQAAVRGFGAAKLSSNSRPGARDCQLPGAKPAESDRLHHVMKESRPKASAIIFFTWLKGFLSG